MLFRIVLPPIEGPFTLEHLREGEEWAHALLDWAAGRPTCARALGLEYIGPSDSGAPAVIPLTRFPHQRDGRRWRSNGSPGLDPGKVYYSRGNGSLPGYVWLEVGRNARSTSLGEIEALPDEPGPGSIVPDGGTT